MQPVNRNHFQQWLKALRGRHGLSQEQLAHRMRCSANYIWRLEHGKRYPSKEWLQLLGHVLQLEGEDESTLELFIQMTDMLSCQWNKGD